MVLLVPYCCHTHEAKEMQAVQNGAMVERLCARYTVTGEDNISGEMAGERSVQDMKMTRIRFLGLPRKTTRLSSVEMESLKKTKNSVVESC